MNKVAARYAKALLQLAVEEEVLGQIHQNMVYLAETCAANQSLLHTLKSPIIKHEKKLAVLQAIFQTKVHALTIRLFALVTHRHREAWLPAIAQAFLTQYDEYQGITKAHVTAAYPLSADLVRQLQQVAQKIKPNQQVELSQHIDSTLLGGYVLQVEDKRLDQSLRTSLHTLKKKYITEGY